MSRVAATLAKATDNRAVSPLFREMGGGGRSIRGDDVLRAECGGMHFGEYACLATLVPVGVMAHAFEALWRGGGPGWAIGGVLPLTFGLLHVLPLGLRIRAPQVAFWVWGGLLAAGSAGLLWTSEFAAVRGVGAVWLAFMAVQAAALGFPLWHRLMAAPGSRGMALRGLLAAGAHLLAIAVGWQFGWPSGLACLGVAVGLWAWGTFSPGSKIFGPVARRVAGPGILLSLDDGPDPDDTPAILDALDAAGEKAVFFVIGEKVRAHPELAREIVARGHELGNHTMTHPQRWMWGLGPGRTRREISECQRAIETATGMRPRWFRAPVGHCNFFTHPVTRELGLDVVAWSRRAYDTRETDVAEIVRRLTDGAGNGDVLLIHEATPVARDAVPAVLDALPHTATRADRSRRRSTPPQRDQ